MANTCCPQYTIRLDALAFDAGKDKKLRKVMNRWKRFVVEGVKPGDEGEAGAKDEGEVFDACAEPAGKGKGKGKGDSVDSSSPGTSDGKRKKVPKSLDLGSTKEVPASVTSSLQSRERSSPGGKAKGSPWTKDVSK